jgi:predicted transcriptional regulator
VDRPEIEAGSIDELTRVIVIALRYRVPQAVLIHDLTKAGLGPSRIAELLGTTPQTVSVTKTRKRPDFSL